MLKQNATLGLISATVLLIAACGHVDSNAAQVLEESPPSQQATNEQRVGSALDLVVPGVKFCGNEQTDDMVIDSAFNGFVSKLADFCNKQNAELRAAKMPSCEQDACIENSVTGTVDDNRRLRVALYAVPETGAYGFRVSLLNSGDLWNRSLPSLGTICMHAKLVAEYHFGLREKLVEKSFEAKMGCGKLP